MPTSVERAAISTPPSPNLHGTFKHLAMHSAMIPPQRYEGSIMRSTYVGFTVAAMVTLHAPAARGQDRAGTWGFVNARYDTRASAYIYTGYGWRNAFAMAGVVNNPRTGFAELAGGAGVIFKAGADAEHWIAFATAGAGSLSSAQIYWLPRVRTGAVTSRATVKWKIPYHGSQPQKLSVSPLSVTMPLLGGLAGGMATEVAAAEGARTDIGAGPELRLKLPGAALVLDALENVTGKASGVRLSFASTF
jgi:hypothetical protein